MNELHERTSRLKHSDVQREVKAEVPEYWMTQAETLGPFLSITSLHMSVNNRIADIASGLKRTNSFTSLPRVFPGASLKKKKDLDIIRVLDEHQKGGFTGTDSWPC